MMPILNIALRHEQDVVVARQRAKQVAALLGFGAREQTALATAVSELARNAYLYGRRGKVEYCLEDSVPLQTFWIQVRDQGPGITDLPAVLEGRTSSPGGTGLGIAGARRLVDVFGIESSSDRGTTVRIGKRRPEGSKPLGPAQVDALCDELRRLNAATPFEEVRQQNQELIQALEALEASQQELLRLNRELEDTNRGVVALYSELDEKAQSLHRADRIKSQFLAHMSHEFRTPLNSILALARLLIDRSDGDLTEEQEKQVDFIRVAANDMLELVNDLLDLARVEAGTAVVRPSTFSVSDVFSTLRGMFFPLLHNPDLSLDFREDGDVPDLYSDEGKLTQILRNLISNALKFTERGEVRVRASLDPSAKAAVFSVEDTGIGIPAEHQERIFEEFGQLEHPIQQRVKGSGLGLTISKRLATLLGGDIDLRSEPGEGSTFSVSIPLAYQVPVRPQDADERDAVTGQHLRPAQAPRADRGPPKLLIMDDNETDRYLLRSLLVDRGLAIAEAGNGADGLRRAKAEHPDVVILDLNMPGLDGFEVLDQMRSDTATRDIPAIVLSSRALSEAERRRLARDTVAVLSKAVFAQEGGGLKIEEALTRALAAAGGNVADRSAS